VPPFLAGACRHFKRPRQSACWSLTGIQYTRDPGTPPQAALGCVAPAPWLGRDRYPSFEGWSQIWTPALCFPQASIPAPTVSKVKMMGSTDLPPFLTPSTGVTGSPDFPSCPQHLASPPPPTSRASSIAWLGSVPTRLDL
jgi:hypothetical protein